MSRTLVTVRVAVPDAADFGDRVQIYTDFGTGTIDFGSPLLPAPAPLFGADGPRYTGIGSVPLGEDRIGFGAASSPVRPAFGDEPIGQQPVGTLRPYVDVDVLLPPSTKTHKFAARLVDERGNESSAPATEIVNAIASEDPPEVSDFAFSSYDGPSDALTFSFSVETE